MDATDAVKQRIKDSSSTSKIFFMYPLFCLSCFSLNRNDFSRSKNKTKETEDDGLVLERREKQIEYGKNTLAYDRYCQAVSKQDRSKEMPKTPNKHVKYRYKKGQLKNFLPNICGMIAYL